jgi:2-dehydropantoate 2-reductase
VGAVTAGQDSAGAPMGARPVGILGAVSRRYVVYGAGAIGGVIAAQLHRAGLEVAVIARGEHLAAIRRDGLTLRTPEGAHALRVEAAAAPVEIRWRDDDIVLLAMKSQDTEAALAELAAVAPQSVVVVCAQNGVANERAALRRFENTLGMCVICPASHLAPGIVEAESLPCPGILDVGRYPEGVASAAEEVAGAMTAAAFSSRAVPDVMRWKYAKLLVNLGNAVEAVCGTEGRGGELARLVHGEGVGVLDAAGIAHVSAEEDATRRDGLLSLRPVEGRIRGGGSSWQSLTRGAGSIEADYLNGEIVLLGRLHGLATPANATLQRIANRMARDRVPPGAVTEEEVLAAVTRSG